MGAGRRVTGVDGGSVSLIKDWILYRGGGSDLPPPHAVGPVAHPPGWVGAILRNSFRLMKIRGPWLAYVLVRQLCFIVADEDVRHAQPPQSERYFENNSNPI